MGSVTINDISVEAGVSKATVSRVLNNPSIVDPVTFDRVKQVMDKFHYVPSAAARNLSKSTSSTIGAVVADISNPFLSELLKGVLEECTARGYTMLCADNGDDMKMDFRALNTMREQRVAGLIYAPAVDYKYYKKSKQLVQHIEDLNAPVVLVDRKVCWGDFTSDGVFFDDYNAIKYAISALRERGHKRIALINSSEKNAIAENRQKGYIDGILEADLDLDESIIYSDGKYTVESGYNQTKRMMMSSNPPTAVITCNNLLSQGFIKAKYENRESCNIEFVGLDRLEMMEILGIKYNHIERDSLQMGKEAAKLLFSRIENPSIPRQEKVLQPPLVFMTE
ncbi:MAG: LacI family DNA-binding transcriptional regulator [Eubacteriales bacterium]|nr:LacI family DNA-binding transcriptional regulator [Eubacteriales bacterium]